MNTTRIHRHRSDSFSITPNDILMDHRLSWKAKGILCYLISKPPAWQPRTSDLSRYGTDGKSSVQAGLRELLTHGYAKWVSERDGEGRLAGRVLHITDTPNQFCSIPAGHVYRPTGFTPDGKSDTSNNLIGEVRTEYKKELRADLIPAALDTPEFLAAWSNWKTYRRNLKPQTRELQLKKLSMHPVEVAIQMIETSISNGWLGLFPPKTANPTDTRPSPNHVRRGGRWIHRSQLESGI